MPKHIVKANWIIRARSGFDWCDAVLLVRDYFFLIPVFTFTEPTNGSIVYHKVTSTSNKSRYVASNMTNQWGIETILSEVGEDCAILCHLKLGCAGFMHIKHNRTCQILVIQASNVIEWLLPTQEQFHCMVNIKSGATHTHTRHHHHYPTVRYIWRRYKMCLIYLIYVI